MHNIANYIGIPYQVKARSETAVDCWGLLCMFYKNELGIDLPQYTVQYDTATPEGFKQLAEVVATGRLDSEWEKVTELAFGDVLLFRVQGLPIHCGVFLETDEFLHAFHGRNSCVERLSSITWAKRLDGAYRWKG